LSTTNLFDKIAATGAGGAICFSIWIYEEKQNLLIKYIKIKNSLLEYEFHLLMYDHVLQHKQVKMFDQYILQVILIYKLFVEE
jgi:hypothetical protein